MKPIRNEFLITTYNDSDELNLIGLDGKPLIIPKRFNPLHHTSQYGTIYEIPFEFDERSIDTKNLKVGDKIFFHYLVCEEINKIVVGELELYSCSYDQIWAKIEGEQLVPLDEVLFAQHIIDDKLTTDSGLIIKQYESNVAHRMVATNTSSFCKFNGINDGDILITIKGAGIPMKDSNNTVWIKLSNIVGIEKNGEIIPQSGMHLIKEDEVPNINMWNGMLIGDKHRCKFLTGEYIRGGKVKQGQKVTFIHNLFSRIELDGIKYACVKDKDLIFINKHE